MWDFIALLFGIVVFIVFVIGWMRIFSKAGHSGLYGLLMFVPILNIIMFLYLAYGEWPIRGRGEVDLDEYEEREKEKRKNNNFPSNFN